MDDLTGIDWSAPAQQQSKSPSTFPPYRQSPTLQLSGRSTPLSAQQSGTGATDASNRPLKVPSKPGTPANDSFAGLLSTGSSKPATKTLSLIERQKQLQEERQRQDTKLRQQYDSHFGATDSRFWDNLGSGKSTPEPAASSPQQRPAVHLVRGPGRSKTVSKSPADQEL